MWKRKELKARAKQAMHGNYWRCVLVALIIGAITACVGVTSGSATGITNSASSSQASDEIANLINSLDAQELMMVAGVFLAVIGALLMVSVIGTLVHIFVLQVFEVGGCRFFMVNDGQPAKLGELVYGFRCGHYGKVVLTMFLMNLFTALWSCLFIIPGIIKAYSYRMIPYIMADHPEVSRKEAFEISRAMMKGNKWRAFVLDLSFIGWYLLSGLTLGIVGIFYVDPYKMSTDAELYLALRDAAPRA